MSEDKPVKKLTGRKVFWMFFAAFGVIFSVNMLLLFKAVDTFPGLEVKNSYVASQTFDDMAQAQMSLGWEPAAAYENGRVDVSLTGADGVAVFPDNFAVRIGRPTHGRDDHMPELTKTDDGYWFPIDLEDGKWFVYLNAISRSGTPFKTRLEFVVNTDDG